jgi:methionine salvage enolase-phosphatase E1
MSSNQIPWLGIAGATFSAAALYCLYQSVSDYGWEGALRYIREGDPYAPAIREYMHILDQVEKSGVTQEIRINIAEEALERARLVWVDADSRAKTTKEEIVMLWIEYYPPKNLKKALGDISYILDQLAAQVDGVLLLTTEDGGSASSHILTELKRRKKLLSQQLVLNMERCDALMKSFQVLQDPYAPTIREYMHILDQVEKSGVTQEIRITTAEEALERARLVWVDADSRATTTKEIDKLWIDYYSPKSLKKTLGDISHILDRLAAQVDGVLLSTTEDGSTSSHILTELKRRKKLLSQQLVLNMERCDVLMMFFQVLQE